ncbi:MAG: PKD domain-containing protein [Ferruginibacter sp.]|nr:PKD domain-containing protein [Chitinophagaceae bacterium]
MKKVYILLCTVVLMALQGCDKNNDSPGTAVDANFSISDYEKTAPVPVTFINTSLNATSYLWNFGDNTSSTESNPVHTYNRYGSYLLKLKATGSSGSDSVCKMLYIDTLVANKSSFSYFFDKCSGYPIGASFKTVNPLSTNTVWDFGNGIININRDPIIQFVLPGDYTIKYSSQISGVRDTVTRIIRII